LNCDKYLSKSPHGSASAGGGMDGAVGAKCGVTVSRSGSGEDITSEKNVQGAPALDIYEAHPNPHHLKGLGTKVFFRQRAKK